MTTRDYFKRALDAERRIRYLWKRRQHLEELATGNTTFTSGGIHATSGNHSKIEQAVVSIVDLDRALEKEFTQYKKIVGEAEQVINSLPTERYRNLLYNRYLCGMSFEQIAEAMNYSTRHILRMHGEALLEASHYIPR